MLKRTYQKVIAAIILVYALFGFFVLPFVLESKVPEIASEYSDGDLSIKAIHFNPFIFKLTVDNLMIKNPHQEEAISFEKLVVDFEAYSLLAGKIHFKNLLLVKPETTINRLEDGSFDFAWLVKTDANATQEVAVESNETAPLPAIRIDTLRIVDGAMNYNDNTREKPFKIHMGPFGFTLTDIDTADLDNSDDALRFHTRISDGGFLDIKSEIISVEPFALNGQVKFESGKLFTEWRYMQEDMKLEVADGRANMSLNFGFDAAKPEETYIDNLHFEINRLRIKPKDEFQDVLRVGALVFEGKRIEPMKQRVELTRLDIDNVAFYATRYKDLSINWAHYLSSNTTQAKESEKESVVAENNETAVPWYVHLEHFGMKNFEAHFNDEGVNPKGQFDVNDMNISVTNISSLANTPLHYEFAMRVNQEMLCESKGSVAHTPLDVTGNMGCEKIQLPWFDTYINDAAQKALKKYDIKLSDGAVAFGSDFDVKEHNSSVNVILEHAYTHLDKVLVQQRSNGKSLYRLKHFGVDEVRVDTQNEKVQIATLDYNNMWLYVERMKSGDINWNKIVVPKSTATSKKRQKTSSDEKKSDWRIQLNTLVMRGGVLDIKDKTLEKPLSHCVDKIYLKVRNIDSASRTYLNYYSSLRLNRKGTLKTQGRLRHTPLRNSSKVHISDIDLSDINPYLIPTLYTNLKNGRFSLDTTLEYAPSKESADLVAQGEIGINDFIVEDAHDDSVLLAFSQLDVAPFHFELQPTSLFINEVKIAGLYTNAHIDQNRTLNFSQLSKLEDTNSSDVNVSQEPELRQEDSNVTQEKVPVRVVKLKIVNGNADFADDSLPIPFQTHIHDLNGFVYGISSLQEETSYVKLAGIIDNYGSAKISGSLNSAKPHEYTDIGVLFRNINLESMSGYSGKFAGRKIDSGKLFLDLKYEIIKSQMLGENSIVIKKMAFGDDVESEDAVSLPLDLAIALLEDGEGVIDIEMPVEGDLDNPDFKYGSVVWQVFSNLIVKAVSSPFKFLMGDDAENIQFIQFEPGSITLLPPEVEKLDTLSKALSKRPKLALAVNGSYDTVADTYALQLEKLTILALDGKEKGEGESMTRDRLEDLYKELLGSDKLDALEEHIEKTYPDSDEKAAREYQKSLINDLVHSQKVSQAELDDLAKKRSMAISNYLILNRAVQANRVETKPPIQSENEATTYVDTKLDLVVAGE